jgi:hypothetical protein
MIPNHVVFFFYFPLKSNHVLRNSTTPDKDSEPIPWSSNAEINLHAEKFQNGKDIIFIREKNIILDFNRVNAFSVSPSLYNFVFI